MNKIAKIFVGLAIVVVAVVLMRHYIPVLPCPPLTCR